MERIGIDTLHKLFYGHPPKGGEVFCFALQDPPL